MTFTQKLVLWLLLLVIVVGAILLIFVSPKNAQAPITGSTISPASITDVIEVTAPLKNASVTSPLIITGRARGTWFFEASAPVELRDVTGKVIAQGHLDTLGDWMTEDFVAFKAALTFTKPASGTGTLVLHNDNPSGDPAREKTLEIPVKF